MLLIVAVKAACVVGVLRTSIRTQKDSETIMNMSDEYFPAIK